MFTVIFTNRHNTTLGRGTGVIPATALVEALADLGTMNPLVSRAVLRDWELYELDRGVSVGAAALSSAMREYPIELMDNGVRMIIKQSQPAAV